MFSNRFSLQLSAVLAASTQSTNWTSFYIGWSWISMEPDKVPHFASAQEEARYWRLKAEEYQRMWVEDLDTFPFDWVMSGMPDFFCLFKGVSSWPNRWAKGLSLVPQKRSFRSTFKHWFHDVTAQLVDLPIPLFEIYHRMNLTFLFRLFLWLTIFFFVLLSCCFQWRRCPTRIGRIPGLSSFIFF